jgi:4'-phosphopantetheinyl transferase EntD
VNAPERDPSSGVSRDPWIGVSRDPWIGDLFAADILAGSAPIDERTDDLWPNEREMVRKAVPRRAREFAAGRRVARALLARLGAGGGALLGNPDRSPSWPAGVVGSITHAADLCAVVVSRSAAVAGLGVDVEPDEPLEPELWPRICTPREREHLLEGDTESSGRRARLVFSAKESVYKCVYRHARRVLGFQEVEIEVDFARHRFAVSFDDDVRARLPAGAILAGTFALRGQRILTGATLRASGAQRAEPPVSDTASPVPPGAQRAERA